MAKNNLNRNDPCHCGNGKKYKICHGKQKKSPSPILYVIIVFIFENKFSENNFLNVKLKGPANNTQALHTRVELYHQGTFQKEKINPYRGYLSSTGTSLHFGLEKKNTIDSLKIHWNDKETSTLYNLSINTLIEISYDTIEKQQINKRMPKPQFFKEASSLTGFLSSSCVFDDSLFSDNVDLPIHFIYFVEISSIYVFYKS